MNPAGDHPARSAAGALTLAAWSLYILAAALFYAPDYPASVWPIAGAGVLAGLAVGANFGRWRLAVILASCVYLAFYVVRVLRMVALTSGFEISSLPTAFVLYFRSLANVTIGMLQDRGVAASLMHGYIEYAMPLLSLTSIVLAVLSRRPRGNAPGA